MPPEAIVQTNRLQALLYFLNEAASRSHARRTPNPGRLQLSFRGLLECLQLTEDLSNVKKITSLPQRRHISNIWRLYDVYTEITLTDSLEFLPQPQNIPYASRR
jgi:hypothetical protein